MPTKKAAKKAKTGRKTKPESKKVKHQTAYMSDESLAKILEGTGKENLTDLVKSVAEEKGIDL